jgi:hypothetical protein
MRIYQQMRLSKRSRKLGKSQLPSVVEFESYYSERRPLGH